MKTPSIVQIFFARGWPLKIWLGGWTLGIATVVIAATAPTLATFSDWSSLLLFALVVIVSPVLGFFLGILTGAATLFPVYELRERLNGGPFKAGDSVQILIGPHRGRITTVIRPWQGRSYRVKLDDEAERTFKDVFAAEQLMKDNDAEQSSRRLRFSPFC